MRLSTSLGYIVIAALLIAAILAALNSFPGLRQTGSSSTCPTRPSTKALSSGSANTATVTATPTLVESMITTTIPYAQTYTNETVPLDPCLTVAQQSGPLETSSNATAIAASLAYYFGETPIRLTLHRPATCTSNTTSCREEYFPYSTAVDLYVFRSSTGSNITAESIQGRFLELTYTVQNYSTLYDDYFNDTTGVSNSSLTTAISAVSNLMLRAYGVNLTEVTLGNTYESEHWIRVDWTQRFAGMEIANGGEIYFEFYPPTSQVIRLIIIENSIEAFDLCCGQPLTLPMMDVFNTQQGGWYLIPPNFPVVMNASAALTLAKKYGTTILHMNYITYSSIELYAVQDHLYYAATISDQSRTYYLFVNPITGQVAFPQP